MSLLKRIDSAVFGNFLMPDPYRRFRIVNRLIKDGRGLFLDMGCSEGNFERIVHNKKIKFIGADLDFDALKRAKERGLDVVCCSALQLPFKENSFDGCIAIEVLEHIKDDKKSIAEISRILKRNEIACISVPNSDANSVLPFKGMNEKMYTCQSGQHVRRGYTIEKLNQKFGEHDFSLEKSTYDLKAVGALLSLIWFNLVYNEESKGAFWRPLRMVYVRLLILFGFCYALDDLVERKGLTIFAKYRKTMHASTPFTSHPTGKGEE